MRGKVLGALFFRLIWVWDSLNSRENFGRANYAVAIIPQGILPL